MALPKKKLEPPRSIGRFPPFALIRVFVLAAIATAACVWALVSVLAKPKPVPVTPQPEPEDDSGLIWIPLDQVD